MHVEIGDDASRDIIRCDEKKSGNKLFIADIFQKKTQHTHSL